VSKKRGRSKKQPVQVQAIPEEFLAEGSGPHEDIEAISGILPAEELEVTAIGEDALQAPVDGEMAADGELTAQGDSDGELAAQGDSDVDGDGELTAQGDSDSDGDGELTAQGDSDSDGELAAQGDSDSDGELMAQGDSDSDGELMAQGDSDGELMAQGADVDGEGDVEGEAAAMPTSAASMDTVQFKQLVEALVFASDKPITVQRLRQLTRVSDVARIEQTLADIAVDYAERGLVLQQVSGGFQFRTRPQFSAWVQQLIAGRPVRLSRAQLETLAIIAYRQPITRPEIDDIRGVDSSATLKLLMDRLLIRVLGKKEEVGRPMLYGTTREFLDFFSLGDLRELPTLREYSELSDESRKVMSSRLGIGMDGEGGGGNDGGGNDGGGNDDGGGSDDGGGDDGGGSSGSGGSSGGEGGGGSGDPANLGDQGGSDHDEMSATSLSDLASHVLSSETRDVTNELPMHESDAADAASDDETPMSADGDAIEAANDDESPMSAESDAETMVAADVADASNDDGMPMSADGDAADVDADASNAETMVVADVADAPNDGEPAMSADDAGDANDANHAGDDDETISVDAETRQVMPIIVEDVDLDAETRDIHPVTDTMTLADAPDLERSETRIVDPLIAAEVLAHAETNVSSGESPE